jgi:hypothetical protein
MTYQTIRNIKNLDHSIDRYLAAKRDYKDSLYALKKINNPDIGQAAIKIFNQEVAAPEEKIPEHKEIFIANEKCTLELIEKKMAEKKKNKGRDIGIKIVSLLLCMAVIAALAAAVFFFTMGNPVGLLFLGVIGFLNLCSEFGVAAKSNKHFHPLGLLIGPFRLAVHCFKKPPDLSAAKAAHEQNIAEAIPLLRKMCANAEARSKLEQKVQALQADIRPLPRPSVEQMLSDNFTGKKTFSDWAREERIYERFLKRREGELTEYKHLLKQLEIGDRFLARL